MCAVAGTLSAAEQAKPADYYTEEKIYQTRPNPARADKGTDNLLKYRTIVDRRWLSFISMLPFL